MSSSSSLSLVPTARQLPLAAVECESFASTSCRFFSGCGGGGGGDGGGGCGSKEPKERFRMPGREEELRLVAIQDRITGHYQQGNFSKAPSVSQDLLKQTDAHFGRDHPATASA
jgi:hypothetical protein